LVEMLRVDDGVGAVEALAAVSDVLLQEPKAL
jgi:hypothetical protein